MATIAALLKAKLPIAPQSVFQQQQSLIREKEEVYSKETLESVMKILSRRQKPALLQEKK